MANQQIYVPYSSQRTMYTCGPASLQMILRYYGNKFTQKRLARVMKTTREGTMPRNLLRAARVLGYSCHSHQYSSIKEIKRMVKAKLPVIVDFTEPTTNDGHYAVVVGITRHYILLNDPWNGQRFRIKKGEFVKRWHDRIGQRRNMQWICVISPYPLLPCRLD